MTFSQATIRFAFFRAGEKCECMRSFHGHLGRCNKELRWGNLGDQDSPFGWEAHHTLSQRAGGADILQNCEIICMDCHQKTKSYGL